MNQDHFSSNAAWWGRMKDPIFDQLRRGDTHATLCMSDRLKPLTPLVLIIDGLVSQIDWQSIVGTSVSSIYLCQQKLLKARTIPR